MEGKNVLEKAEACKMLPKEVKSRIGQCNYKDGWLLAGQVSVDGNLFIADPKNAGTINDKRSSQASERIKMGNALFDEIDNGFVLKPGSGFFPVRVKIGMDKKVKELRIDFTG